MENEIKNLIDSIEPAEGAKERMLANIMKKAGAESESAQAATPAASPSKVINIKWVYRIALTVAACLVAVIAGTLLFPKLITLSPDGPDASVTDAIQYPGGFVSAESPLEFTAKLGFSIEAPEGCEDASYCILDDKIAQIIFWYGDTSYTYMASRQSGDFTGVEGKTLETEQIDSKTSAILFKIDDNGTLIEKLGWSDGAVNYFLFCCPDETSLSVREVYEKIKP